MLGATKMGRAGYFGLISTLRANIYQSEIDFCWFNIDSYC